MEMDFVQYIKGRGMCCSSRSRIDIYRGFVAYGLAFWWGSMSILDIVLCKCTTCIHICMCEMDWLSILCISNTNTTIQTDVCVYTYIHTYICHIHIYVCIIFYYICEWERETEVKQRQEEGGDACVCGGGGGSGGEGTPWGPSRALCLCRPTPYY